MLCDDGQNNGLSIWIQFSTLDEILQSPATTGWNKMGEVNDAAFFATKGIIGAQFCIPSDMAPDDDDDDFAGCSSFDFSVSVLFEMSNGERSTLKVDIVWRHDDDNATTRYDIVSKWVPYEETLNASILKQSDDIYGYLKDVCGIDNKGCDENGYRRNDFCWVPKTAFSSGSSSIISSSSSSSFASAVVKPKGDFLLPPPNIVRRRGRPAGKKDTAKRVRSVSMTLEESDWSFITILKLLYLSGSTLPGEEGVSLVVNRRIYEPYIAALFTLTEIFPAWHASNREPIERRIYHMFGELQPALDDNAFFLQDFSDKLCSSVDARTMVAYKRFKFRIDEWLEMGGKCDFLRGTVSSNPTQGWGEFNKDELVALGTEKFQSIIVAEKSKKRGLETIYVEQAPSSSSSLLPPSLGGSWEEIQEQFTAYQRRVRSEVDDHYKTSQPKQNQEELNRMKMHKKDIERVYEAMNTVMHEAVDISTETDKLVALLKSIKKKRGNIEKTLQTLLPEVTMLTHYCSSTAVENGVESVVRNIMDQSQKTLDRHLCCDSDNGEGDGSAAGEPTAAVLALAWP